MFSKGLSPSQLWFFYFKSWQQNCNAFRMSPLAQMPRGRRIKPSSIFSRSSGLAQCFREDAINICVSAVRGLSLSGSSSAGGRVSRKVKWELYSAPPQVLKGLFSLLLCCFSSGYSTKSSGLKNTWCSLCIRDGFSMCGKQHCHSPFLSFQIVEKLAKNLSLNWKVTLYCSSCCHPNTANYLCLHWWFLCSGD